jgi:hypothetical protein
MIDFTSTGRLRKTHMVGGQHTTMVNLKYIQTCRCIPQDKLSHDTVTDTYMPSIPQKRTRGTMSCAKPFERAEHKIVWIPVSHYRVDVAIMNDASSVHNEESPGQEGCRTG